MMTAVSPTDAAGKAEARPRRHGPASLVAKGAALVLATAASVVAICTLVPDVNDYAKATLLKHAALRADTPRKIVLVGGSNLAFGVDSTLIREATGCPVVNMGMNGHFGARYMLAEVRDNLRSGDLVIIAWEWDNYFKSVDGAPGALFAVTKTNPEAFSYLTLGQLAGVAGQYPAVAQQKVIRLLFDAREFVKSLYIPGYEGGEHEARRLIRQIESLAGFTPEGDLVSHLGVKWPANFEYGLDLVELAADDQIVPLMVDFSNDMKAKGVAAMVSFTPIIDYYYADQKREIDRISMDLQSNPDLKVPRPASEFVFPPSQHFDTVYHLNAEGRAIRSRMLAEDILKTFGDRARCGTTTPTT
jgi:hypothetical protein